MVVLKTLCMGCMEEKGDKTKCPKCGFVETAPPESPNYLPPRTMLQNKYLIGKALGQGGFAITYLAWDINLGIKLAIKEYFPLDLVYRNPGNNMVIAHSKSQDSIFAHDMEKFLQEARILAQFMDHPNIVSVTDFFQANRTAYLVMHYIEGVTLRHHLAQVGEKLPFNTTMEIIMPVMDALRVVHEAGLLHRDISPENIIISQKGRVLLIDFGAARTSAGGRGESLSVVMKPGYTPEEQYRSRGTQGPATDIYAVAATIYRTVTGHMPPNSLDRLAEDHLTPPSQLGVELDPAAEEALLKAMAVKSSDRYQSMAEFQQALMQIKLPPREEKKEKPSPAKKTEKKAPEKETPEKEEAEPSTQPSVQPQPSERSFTSMGDIKIGRAADNEIVLDDETASRYHALIFSREGHWFIADLDSTHGTYVNDIKIEEPVELIPPAEIKLSESVFTYDGQNLFNEQGEVVQTLTVHQSFTERWLTNENLSPKRLIENFIASLEKLTRPPVSADTLLTVNIGRAVDNDLVINDDMVSRYHARLFVYNNSWYIADLQSTHGTMVNDMPVDEPVGLNNSDIITISEIKLKLNNGHIYSEEGEVLYTLPVEEHVSGRNSAQPGFFDQFIDDGLLTQQFWIIIVAVVGLLAVILLLVLLLI